MGTISEKSLEMNVNENLVNSIRRWSGLFSNTFIYGFTLREEKQHGLDSSINLPGGTKFLFALQYKKPISKYSNKYYFQINGRQHVTLLISSLHYKNVWYVFPLFINTNELALSSPNFLDRAYFVKINNFPSCTFDGNPHKVEIDPQKQSVSIFSNDKVGLKAYNGKEFLIKMKEEIIPITIEEIKMKKLTWEYIYPKLEELGVKKITLDRIREKDKKLHHRFTSGFFLVNKYV